MRVIIACVIVVLSVIAALGVAQTQNVFTAFTGRTEAPAVRVASVEKPVAPKPASVVSTVATAVAPAQPVATAPTASAPAVTAAAPAPTATTTAPTPTTTPSATTSATAGTPAPQMVAQAPVPVAAPSAPKPAPVAATPPSCLGNPDALGVTRTVEIDTTGGPGFGFEHFKQYDFLKPGEVVLTFDDGPWEGNTPKVLAALAHHCLKATFFPIGKHATYYPDILRQVAAAGHTIGSHTWSHANLNKKGMTSEEQKQEIEMGISAVHMAVEGNISPFFRFPALQHPPELLTYLAERNVAIFSTDMDSFDFKMRKPDQVIKSVMEKLKKHGKGIVLMHDFQHATAEALPTLLDQLKLNGYKIVHMRAKGTLQPLPQYDEMVRKEQKLPIANTRPTAEVVKTVE
ncbi:MAG: polysaccharide deacetylase family protein [Xanthobacteraceae bacterium]